MRRGQAVPLRTEVKELLLTILRDPSAPATARASAGRTLIEMDAADSGGVDGGRPANELTADEIDAELAASPQKQR